MHHRITAASNIGGRHLLSKIVHDKPLFITAPIAGAAMTSAVISFQEPKAALGRGSFRECVSLGVQMLATNDKFEAGRLCVHIFFV